MKLISELQNTLSHFFNWNKARLNCLVQILQALFVVRTVNLTQIAAAFKTMAQEESSYRRVCRFFTDFSFDMSTIVLLVLRIFPLGDKYILILDRTNWKWGKSSINILMLSVAYLGISIPLFWVVLDIEGNSCTEDRIRLLKRVIQRLGREKIEVLLADREFIGSAWLGFLIGQNIPFIVRIKQNSTVTIDDKAIIVSDLRRLLSKRRVINYPVILWGHSLYVSIEKRKGAKEPMIIVSNLAFANPLEMYRRRWEIETMFGCFKTRGFRMEDTHLTDADKIEKLVFVLAIAFCWAYRTGDIQVKQKAIVLKTHGRKARSLFREGLNLIRRGIFESACMKKIMRLLGVFNDFKSMGCNA